MVIPEVIGSIFQFYRRPEYLHSFTYASERDVEYSSMPPQPEVVEWVEFFPDPIYTHPLFGNM